jgi:hypothetical protein
MILRKFRASGQPRHHIHRQWQAIHFGVERDDEGLRHTRRPPLRLSSWSQYAIKEQREDHNVGGDQRPLMVINAKHISLPIRLAQKASLHKPARSFG